MYIYIYIYREILYIFISLYFTLLHRMMGYIKHYQTNLIYDSWIFLGAYEKEVHPKNDNSHCKLEHIIIRWFVAVPNVQTSDIHSRNPI